MTRNITRINFRTGKHTFPRKSLWNSVLSNVMRNNWTFTLQKYISESDFSTLLQKIVRMLLNDLKATFTKTIAGPVLGAALAFGAAMPIATIPGPANDAYAQSGQIASAPAGRELNAVQGMRDMRRYSEDAATRGIGVFINLQANALMTGQQIGEKLRTAFGSLNPPVPVEYRFNQSRGTATDVTFYVRGVDFTMTVTDIVNKGLTGVLAHHRGAWLPETASLESNKPAVTR